MSFKPAIPVNLHKLTSNDIQEMRGKQWSQADRQTANVSGLPLHLRSIVYIIGTHGNRNFVDQEGVYIPGSSIVRLYNATGVIEMGWNRFVDPTGRFLDNGEIFGPAEQEFTIPGLNRYCMLVATPSVYFKNSRIPKFGASVGDATWLVAANEGGICKVAFNDNDNNNSGTFTQFLEVTEASVFAEKIANLAKY